MNREALFASVAVLLAVIFGGVAAKFYLDYNNAKKGIISWKQRYDETTKRLAGEKQALQQKIARLNDEISRLKKDISTYKSQISSMKLEKGKWEEKYNSVLKEKVSLKEKINSLEEQLDAKKEEIGDLKAQLEKAKSVGRKETQQETISDEFWADVVKRKAELEAKVEKLESELREKEVARKEAIQKKLELELKYSQLQSENMELLRQLEYSKRMINILTRDYVREKEDRRAMSELLEKIQKENDLIKNKVVKLTKSETYLEKELARKEEERDILKRHIEDMNTVVRDSIDKILTLTDKMGKIQVDASKNLSKSKVVSLPPIIVGEEKPAISSESSTSSNSEIKGGKILNVNEAHNFVVIDLGKNDGVVEGMEFDVLRGGSKIARVKVKMLKDDVCAADIIKFYSDQPIKVGDEVK